MESQKSQSWKLLLFTIVFCQGCVHGITHQRSHVTRNAIPAHRLPAALSAVPKDRLVPVEWTRLRRPPVREHLIGADDVLGVHIEEVLPVDSPTPVVFFPAGQDLVSPSVGQPIRVRADGTVFLPLVGSVDVAGLTIPQATERVRDTYVSGGFLNEERLVSVELIRGRTVKVFVVRDDTSPLNANVTNRGNTSALDLPVFENDILHALSASGGLPAEDGFNEVWVLRGATVSDAQQSALLADLREHLADQDVVPAPSQFIRVPLRLCPGQEVPFRPEDVILHDGDVVFIESRVEFFTTGGMLSGGRIPLPRDEDVDILQALALAGSNVLGPAGQGVGNNFRGGPGALIPPTRATVIRQLDSGEQIKIAVDIRAALNDPKERLLIAHRDTIILQYKPTELVGNFGLNILGVNFLFDDAIFRVNQ